MKIDIDLLKNEYDNRTEELKFLINTVHFILQKEISGKRIMTHSLTNRIKKFDSFLKKIRRKNIQDPFNEIHDLAGLRVVCLFRPDLETIGKIIHNRFDVFEEDNKVDKTELDIFGYMSLHYKAKLKQNDTTQGLDFLKDTPFEIQVRTIAQDAWASISHHLDYKQESFLPDQLKRDFHALSGLFYVADTHFTLLRQEQSKFFVEETFKKEDGATSA